MDDFRGYPMFKGLQRPLEFMGIRGRFIYIAAGAIGASFIGFLMISFLFGRMAGFIGMFLIILLSLAFIFIKQKQGLHDKKRCRDILMVRYLIKSHFD